MSVLDALPWIGHIVDIAAKVDPPEWWIGAGVIRDIVWGERFARGFDPAMTKDIDLAFFDPTNLDPERDRMVEAELRSHDVGLPWDAKNQAAVRLWYPKRFGLTVDPLAAAEDAVATFPEFATCVAVRRLSNGTWDVTAPYGSTTCWMVCGGAILGVLRNRSISHVLSVSTAAAVASRRIAR